VDTVKNIKSHLKVRSFFDTFFGWFFYGGGINYINLLPSGNLIEALGMNWRINSTAEGLA
jgi:hypothetical protein